MNTAELYALPPEEFTTARDAAAKQAKAAGDPAAGKELKALRRPSVAAWLVNRLAAEQGALLEQLLALGPALAEAQAAGHADDLRALGRQRRQLVEAVAGTAVSAAGRPVAGPVRDEVVSTLEAALADPSSAEAVRSGRLVRALSYAGFGEVDLSGAVAAGATTASVRPTSVRPTSVPATSVQATSVPATSVPATSSPATSSPATSSPATSSPATSSPARPKGGEGPARKAEEAAARARAALAAAEGAAHEAAGRLDDAVLTAERAERAATVAAGALEQAGVQLRQAEETLARALETQDTASGAADEAEAEAESAREAVRVAQDDAGAARAELDRLRRS